MKRLVVIVAVLVGVGAVEIGSAQSRDPFRPPPGLTEGPSAPGAPAPIDPIPRPPEQGPAIDDLPRTGQDLGSPVALALFFIVSGLALRAATAPSRIARRPIIAG